MSTKALVLAIVATACVGAAAAGGYVALRFNTANPMMPGPVKASTSAQAPAAGAAPAATERAKMPGQYVPVPAAPVPGPTIAKPADARQGGLVSPPATSSTAPAIETAGVATPTSTSWATPSPSTTVATATELPVQTPVVETAPPVQDPPKPRFDELTIKSDAVIGIRLDTAISSQTAKVEDKVIARVARDVTVDGRTAILAGTQLEGNVTMVERGGKFKSPGRLAIKFHTVILADGTRVPMQTEAISRAGESPANAATAKVGAGAVIGAIIGSMLGGRKGAAIGTAAGAAGGTAAVAASDANEAIIPAGAALTVRLTAPVTILVERDDKSH